MRQDAFKHKDLPEFEISNNGCLLSAVEAFAKLYDVAKALFNFKSLSNEPKLELLIEGFWIFDWFPEVIFNGSCLISWDIFLTQNRHMKDMFKTKADEQEQLI